jgi:hypothetical protein
MGRIVTSVTIANAFDASMSLGCDALQSQAAVDMLGHRLVHVKWLDLKGLGEN